MCDWLSFIGCAEKLGTDPETVQSVVEKLADLMLQCSKVEVQHEELLELLQGVVPEEVAELFWRRLQSDGPALRLLLRQVRPQRVTYDSLDWRLQCTVNRILRLFFTDFRRILTRIFPY